MRDQVPRQIYIYIYIYIYKKKFQSVTHREHSVPLSEIPIGECCLWKTQKHITNTKNFCVRWIEISCLTVSRTNCFCLL